MEISDKQYLMILKKQFNIANVPESYLNKLLKTPKEKQGEWFRKYSWTEKQQNEFKQWLIKFLMKRYPIYKKKCIEKHASMFLFEFGWTTMDIKKTVCAADGSRQSIQK